MNRWGFRWVWEFRRPRPHPLKRAFQQAVAVDSLGRLARCMDQMNGRAKGEWFRPWVTGYSFRLALQGGDLVLSCPWAGMDSRHVHPGRERRSAGLPAGPPL